MQDNLRNVEEGDEKIDFYKHNPTCFADSLPPELVGLTLTFLDEKDREAICTLPVDQLPDYIKNFPFHPKSKITDAIRIYHSDLEGFLSLSEDKQKKILKIIDKAEKQSLKRSYWGSAVSAISALFLFGLSLYFFCRLSSHQRIDKPYDDTHNDHRDSGELILAFLCLSASIGIVYWFNSILERETEGKSCNEFCCPSQPVVTLTIERIKNGIVSLTRAEMEAAMRESQGEQKEYEKKGTEFKPSGMAEEGSGRQFLLSQSRCLSDGAARPMWRDLGTINDDLCTPLLDVEVKEGLSSESESPQITFGP